MYSLKEKVKYLSCEFRGKTKVTVKIIEIENKERLEVVNKYIEDEPSRQTVGNIGLGRKIKIYRMVERWGHFYI